MDNAVARMLLAREGEAAARAHLESLGFELCAMNLRIGSDEADIVMLDPDGRTVVVVEVKTRSSSRTLPEERVDAGKRRSLIRIARAISCRSRTPCPMRIDVVAVTKVGDAPPAIVRFENAVVP